MFTRTTGFFIVPLWLAAMGWLFAHDILPGWTTLEPPAVRPADWLDDKNARAEYVISGSFGRIGSLWTTYLVDEGSIRRDDLVWIETLPLAVTPFRVEANSVFTADGRLDEFTVRLETSVARTPIKLHGERFHADFSFTLEHGSSTSAFKVPLSDGGLLTGAFSPLSRLRNLKVGQTWRMQVFNPLAALTGVGPRFTPLLVSVSGEGRLKTAEWEGNCLIVEAGKLQAWVDATGEVQRQQIELPLLGQVVMDRRPGFDIEARNGARRVQFNTRRERPE